jgi:SAM-dependent methyltransferase
MPILDTKTVQRLITMTSTSESRAELGARLKEQPFYKPILKSIDPDARQILESYAGISPEQVLTHVQTIRDQAWELYPYPCMGMFSFIKMRISRNPAYPTVLKRLLSNNEKLLDIGCGFGQELRTLVAAGVPATNLFGLDVSHGFIELGFELFRDKATMQSQFIIADLLASPTVPPQLQGKLDLIFAGAFFHLFGWDEQLTLSKRALAMLKPQAGSVIFGHQLGQVEAKESIVPEVPSGRIYFHDPESFKKMWRIIGEETRTEWKVQIESSEQWIDDLRKVNPALRLLRFSVERLPAQKDAAASLELYKGSL